jgi:hypothetical protein
MKFKIRKPFRVAPSADCDVFGIDVDRDHALDAGRFEAIQSVSSCAPYDGYAARRMLCN